MPIVTLSDGREIDVPDDAPPEHIAAVKEKIRAFEAGQAKPAGVLESLGRDALAGFGSAATVVGRGAQTAADLIIPPDGGPAGTPGNRTSNPLSRWLGEKMDTAERFYKDIGDKSTNNRTVQAVTRAVAGAPAGGSMTPLALVSAAGGGAGADIADRYAPGNPLAQVAGGVLGGVAAGSVVGTAARARPQSAAIAREALEGISEQELAVAQRYMNEVTAKGTPIDLAQALVATRGNAGNLESIRNTLATRNQGNQVQEQLRRQPEQLNLEAQLVTEGLPGTNWSAQENANFMQKTATDAIKAAKDQRSADVRAMYAQAGDLAPTARKELGKIVNDFAGRPGTTEVMRAKAKEFADKLMGANPDLDKAITAAQEAVKSATSRSEKIAAQGALAQANAAKQAAAGAPLKALDVDTWISELSGPFKGQSLKVAYPKEQGQVKGLAGALNKRFQELSPEVAAAEAKFKQITEATVNPLKQGPVGTLTQPGGYSPDTGAAMSRFEGLMNKGRDPNAKLSDISGAARALGKQDPAAFEDSFKSWVSSKLRKPVESATPGTPLGEADARKLYSSLFEDKWTWQGIKDAAETMADIRGVEKSAYLRGLENLKQLTKAMTSRTEPGGLSSEDLKRLGGSSATADLVRVASFLPMNRLGERIERATLGETLSKFDTILTSPEGAKMLVELGKTPVMSRKAQVLLGTWGSQMGNPPQITNP